MTGSSDVAVCITAVRSLSTRAFIETCYDVIDKFCCFVTTKFLSFFLFLVTFLICYVCLVMCLLALSSLWSLNNKMQVI